MWVYPCSLLIKMFLSKKSYIDWTIFSFGENFLKIINTLTCGVFLLKTFNKDNMGWTVLSFCKKTLWIKPNCLLIKIFEKDKMDWTVFSFGQNVLKRQYGLNCILVWSTFSEKIYGLNPIVFWSKFLIRTVWVELYCLLIKNLNKDNMGSTVLSFDQNASIQKDYIYWTVFYFDQNFIKEYFQKENMGWIVLSFHKNFLKILYPLNQIILWSKFSKRLYGINHFVF